MLFLFLILIKNHNNFREEGESNKTCSFNSCVIASVEQTTLSHRFYASYYESSHMFINNVLKEVAYMIGCLVIHGYTGGPYELEPLVDYLRAQTNWQISVPTLPGHGRNLELTEPCYKQWIQKAEDTLKMLQKKYDTIYVIGFSMGGMIASYLAGTFKVDKLVLLATAGKFIAFRQLSREVGKLVIDGLTGKAHENYIYAWYKRKSRKVPLKAYIEFIKLVKYTRTYLNKIDAPVLIAQGRRDEVVPYQTMHYLDKEIASDLKEIVLFERSNHRICLGEDKDTINDMVYNFLNKPYEKVNNTIVIK